MPKQSTATASASAKARASKQVQTRIQNGKRKQACRRVRTFEEAMKAKEVVQLPNGWKITPPGVKGNGLPAFSIGRPIPDEAYN